jgi:hypothetical protein
MKRLFVFLLLVPSFMITKMVAAYEVQTHEQLSEQALSKSVLASEVTVLTNLGLEPLATNQKFQIPEEKPRTIIELIKDGSKFEDDFPRSLNHFYNPLDNTGISNPSPDWALEDLSDLGGQNNSFKDARQYLLCALAAGADLVCNNRGLSDSKIAFGLTFQTLGQVIHHLQDMAQPQHVRHDQHLKFIPWFDLIPPENPSLYEEYSGQKNVCSTPDLLCSGSLLPATFPRARDFWATVDENGIVTVNGHGIAQYTNRNFVSAGTNFQGTLEHFEPHPDLPFPNGDEATIEVKQVGDPELGNLQLEVDGQFLTLDTRPLDGKLFFVGTPVVDTHLGVTRKNPRTSTFSLYDEDLYKYRSRICGSTASPCAEAQPTFTLNHFNFDKAHQFLIPKAISYSAGLIDYFFRGNIELCDSDDTGMSVIRNLNKTEDMKGTFILYSEDAQGVRQELARWRTRDHLPPEAEGILQKNGTDMRVPFVPPDSQTHSIYAGLCRRHGGGESNL